MLLLCVCSDHNSGKSSLDTLLALLQAEGAKIEEETEVKSVSASILLLFQYQCYSVSAINDCLYSETKVCSKGMYSR